MSARWPSSQPCGAPRVPARTRALAAAAAAAAAAVWVAAEMWVVELVHVGDASQRAAAALAALASSKVQGVAMPLAAVRGAVVATAH